MREFVDSREGFSSVEQEAWERLEEWVEYVEYDDNADAYENNMHEIEYPWH